MRFVFIFEIFRVTSKDNTINYDEFESLAVSFKPRMILIGPSSYPRHIDFARLRQIASKVDAILVGDIAHSAGILSGSLRETSAGQELFEDEIITVPYIANKSHQPFLWCDVVTSTCHKTLRGPRAALIFTRRNGKRCNAIDSGVFPGLQGGPHNNQIAAVAVALEECMHPSFSIYTSLVRRNAKVLAIGLKKRGNIICTNGTDNHIVLWDVSSSFGSNVRGDLIEMILEQCGVYTNRNMIPFDGLYTNTTSAVRPRGLRIGTAALTTRFPNISACELDIISGVIHQAGVVASHVSSKYSCKKMSEYSRYLVDEPYRSIIKTMTSEVATIIQKHKVPDGINYLTRNEEKQKISKI
jgi:glycine hydroxymethyltransferase